MGTPPLLSAAAGLIDKTFGRIVDGSALATCGGVHVQVARLVGDAGRWRRRHRVSCGPDVVGKQQLGVKIPGRTSTTSVRSWSDP